MASKQQQTILWYDDEDKPHSITGVTIENITVDEAGHVEGEWHHDGKVDHVAEGYAYNNTWGFI